MMIPSQRVIFTNVTRRLIHGTSIFNSWLDGEVTLENKELRHKEVPQGRKKFVRERMLEYQNTSIKPYVNVDKIMYLKPFYEKSPKDELCTYSFVKDENVAIDVVEHIVRSQEKKGIVVEGNPGIGLITNHLILSEAFEIIMIKDGSDIHEVVTKNLIALKGNVTRKAGNMFMKGSATFVEALDISKHLDLPVTFIAVTTSFGVVKNLVHSVINYQLWNDQLNVFLLMDKHILQPNLFERITSDELMDYSVFLRVFGRHTDFVIPTLEKWAPGCGPYLISKGISMTTEVGELSHEEALLLFIFFKDFDGYPEFKECSKQIL